MKLDKKLAQAILVGLSLANLFMTEFEVALITFGIAAILYGLTQSLEVAIVTLLAPLAVKASNILLKKEGFQAKDPVSISNRVQSIKVVQKKPDGPIGVLESPEIMSSEPLSSMKELAASALPGESIPAAAAALVPIYTPEENPTTGMRESNPLANPILQNGPDLDGIETALKKTGAASANQPSDLAGIAGNAGQAF